MELRRELTLATGTLVVVNLVLAFGSIGLFVRMGPAIERIIEENVVSIVAAETVLAELADAGGLAVSPVGREAIRRAIEQAKVNVTEAAEQPTLDVLERDVNAALEGDPVARKQVVSSLREIIHINRRAMEVADEDARRLGSAGAWAAVWVGFVSFLLSLLVLYRLNRRLVRPLLELHEVLEGSRQGERLRRCRPTDAPRELEQVAQAVNRLLDERLRRGAGPPAGAVSDPVQTAGSV